jgi:hypothetical protein
MLTAPLGSYPSTRAKWKMAVIVNKNYLFFWVKIFLGMTVFWGVLMGLAVIARFGVSYGAGFTLSLLFGAIFGAFMAIVLGVTDYCYKRKLLRRYGRVEHGVRQKRELLVNDEYDRIFRRSEKILFALGVETVSSDMTNGVIRGRGRPTFRSFGEQILVSLERISELHTKVIIESKPKVPWTVGDYGKNFENVEEFCSLLKGTEA